MLLVISGDGLSSGFANTGRVYIGIRPDGYYFLSVHQFVGCADRA